MELAGIASGGNMRSMLSDFDIKNAAELEAHINMNASAAKINFEKYYKEKLSDVSKLWRDVRRRLDVRDVLEVPAFVLDVGTSRFDYGTIGQLYHDKLEEKVKNSDARKAAKEAGEGVDLLVSVKANMDDPFKLVITGCDYTNVDKVVNNLKGNTEVTHLSLANNGLEADDCDALATLIRENKTIVSLDLSNNKLGGEGIAKLAPALAENRTLTDLDLGANNLAKSAAKALASAIASESCTLTRLQLSGNALGIYGAEELAIGLKANRSIKALGLQNNNLGNDGATKLLEALPTAGLSIDDVAAAENNFNTTLVQISIESNRIDDPIAVSVAKATWVSEQIQVRRHLIRLEEEARKVAEDVEGEWLILGMLWKKATEELKASLAEKAAKEVKPAGGKAPPGKPSSKVPPKASAPARSASKSPEKAVAKAPPATSAKVKAAAGAGAARNPSPKKAK